MSERFNISERRYSWQINGFELTFIPRWIKVEDMTKPICTEPGDSLNYAVAESYDMTLSKDGEELLSCHSESCNSEGYPERRRLLDMCLALTLENSRPVAYETYRDGTAVPVRTAGSDSRRTDDFYQVWAYEVGDEKTYALLVGSGTRAVRITDISNKDMRELMACLMHVDQEVLKAYNEQF